MEFIKTGSSFYFLRHAESLWNVLEICQGWTDIELSEKGIVQAKNAASRIAKIPLTNICSSPLKRALQTAQIAHQFHQDTPFTIIDEFKERGFGAIEGKSSQLMYQIEENEMKDQHFDPKLSIEKRSDFQKRIIQGLQKAFSLYQTPFIVSHGRLFLELCLILNIPPVKQLGNADLVQLIYDGKYWNSYLIQEN